MGGSVRRGIRAVKHAQPMGAGQPDQDVTQAAFFSRWNIRRSALAGIVFYAVCLSLALSVLAANTHILVGIGQMLGVLPGLDPVVQGRIREVLAQGADIPDGAVLILGDSVMEGLDEAAIGPGVHNLGIASLTIFTLESLLPRLRPLPAAGGVILGIGGNDLGYRRHDDIVQDYARLVAAMPKDVPLLIVAVLPMDETDRSVQEWPTLRNANIDALNRAIGGICGRRPRCHLLSAQPFLADAAGNLADGLHAGDGRHLSAAGYRRLTEAIRTMLRHAVRAGA